MSESEVKTGGSNTVELYKKAKDTEGTFNDNKDMIQVDGRPVSKRTIVWNTKSKINLRLKAEALDTFMDEDNGQDIEVLDEPVWESRREDIFRAVSYAVERNTSKYCYRPHTVEVIFHRDDPDKIDDKNKRNDAKYNSKGKDTDVTSNESIHVSDARWTFDDIYVPENVKETIERSLLISRHRKQLFDDWKLGSGNQGRAIVFNFYGPPGTGKSLTGEAIAGELGKKVYTVNYSELESKFVGETPKNIVRVFKKAQEDDAVLIFDEADSFLGKRLTNVTQSADYGVNITRSVMLIELEKFDGIVIFTTNLISNYDEAFKRRILVSMPFDLPDFKGRTNIWEIYLKRGMPLEEGITAESLASAYENISGADIKDITLYAAVSALYRDENNVLLTKKDFDDAYALILRRRNSKKEPAVSIKTERISAEQYKEETNGDIG
jgi:SpoVK/Ycf46/Vps4 family AAA+-type ATPase